MSQPLVFDIIARDRASDTTKRIGSGFSKLGFATAGIFAGMGAAVGRFAVNQLGNAARAVGAFVADSVRQFSDFDRSMREVWTLLPDLSASAFKDLQGDVRGFVTEMGIAHQEAVPALYQAISAGVPQENVFDFLTTAAKFSIGGVTSLETAVDGLTSVTNAYGREVLSAQEASDIFFTTVRLGKCVVGSTRVLLADGSYRRIDQLPASATVVSFDGRNFVPMSAAWIDQGVKPTVTLTTRLGRSITTTWNHPYLTEGGWVQVKDLGIGDRIAIPTSLPYFGQRSVPEHEAALVGLWLAEGSFRDRSVRITTTRFGQDVQTWAKAYECVARQIEKRPGKAATYMIISGRHGRTTNPVMDRLRELGLEDASSGSKHIPDEVFTWDRQSLAVLLRWLFNGDGWLADLRKYEGSSGFQVGFVSKSERLVRDVSHLLLRFGVVGRVRRRSNCWVWEVNRYAEVARFVEHIGIDRPATPTVLSHTPEKQRAMWGVIEYDPVVAIDGGTAEHVYDLTVPHLANFVAEDIVAHNTTAAELSANLFQVIPTAASLGIQFGTVGAALAAITAQGVPTSVATTQLRQMFIELNKEGGKTASLFDDLAGKSFADFIRDGGSVQGALALLTEHAADSNTSLSNLFGSVEAGNAALALTSKSGAALFNGALGEMTDTTGATDDAFSKMDEGMGRTWDRLMIRIDDLKVGLGERLAPAIEGVLDWLERIGENSDQAGETFKALGDAAESELGGRVVPELEEFAQTFQGTMSQNEGALKELTRVVGIALAGQVFNWGVYTKELVFFKDMAVTVLRFTANAVIKWADTFLAAGEAAFGWVPGIGDQFRKARDRMREFRQGINRELDNIRSKKTINIVTQFSTTGTPPPGYAGGSTRIFMQHGGKVAGPFTGVDRVPAMLTTGEFVVNREATARHEPLLRAINSGSPSVTLNQSFSSSGNRADDFIIEVVRRGLRGNAGFRSDLRSAARA
jgi:hypothetical protein